MKAQIAISPNSVPITEEQIKKLPSPPDERLRSYLIYNIENNDNDSLIVDIFNIIYLRECFLEAFPNDYEIIISFIGNESIYIDRFTLQEWLKFNVSISFGEKAVN